MIINPRYLGLAIVGETHVPKIEHAIGNNPTPILQLGFKFTIFALHH